VIILWLGPRAVPVVITAVAVAVVIDVVAAGAAIVVLAAGLVLVAILVGSLNRLVLPCGGQGSVSITRMGAGVTRGTVVPSLTVRLNFGPCRRGSMRMGGSVVGGMRHVVAVQCLNGGEFGRRLTNVGDFDRSWRFVGRK
jgi:hypothetical protein